MADGYLEIEDDNEWELSDGEMKKKEENRQIRVSMKAAHESGRVKDPPPSKQQHTNRELHGDWSGRVIDTTEDYENLSSAAHAGNEFALGYIHYLNSRHQIPSAH